jgi:hypothetical protein
LTKKRENIFLMFATLGTLGAEMPGRLWMERSSLTTFPTSQETPVQA